MADTKTREKVGVKKSETKSELEGFSRKMLHWFLRQMLLYRRFE